MFKAFEFHSVGFVSSLLASLFRPNLRLLGLGACYNSDATCLTTFINRLAVISTFLILTDVYHPGEFSYAFHITSTDSLLVFLSSTCRRS